MGHYDCRCCGEDYGIDFGHCPKCTHKTVLEAKRRLDKRIEEAKIAWERKIADERQQFISDQTAIERAHYYTLYNNFRPKHLKPIYSC